MADKGEARIGFFVYEEFQRPMLAPVYEELRDEFSCVLTSDVNQVIDFRPRILLVATEFYQPFREQLRDTMIIWTRHGFASKNSSKRGVRGCDFACVSSEWVRDDFIRRGWVPRLGFWITGFVPMDPVLRGDRAETEHCLPNAFRPDQPVLLFAPTWNRNLGATEVLGTAWLGQLLQQVPTLQILMKPHPRLAESHARTIQKWRDLAREVPRVAVVDDLNASIYDLFPIADILLTDVSSVMFYYLFLDRPIILVNNPRRLDERKYYDPDGYEWTWRDMGIEVESPEELFEAVIRSLENPAEWAGTRALYRERVFGEHVEGQAATHIAKKVRTLIHPTHADEAWVDISWNSVAAMGQLEAHRQSLPGMWLIRWAWRFFGRNPWARAVLRRTMYRYPRLHSEIYRLADRISGQSRSDAKRTDEPTNEPRPQEERTI